MTSVILAIDLQYDFCNPSGSLYVNGAAEDTKRISDFIGRKANEIDAVIMSMDSHQPIHIAHQVYWKDSEGKHPDVYTTISKDEVLNKKWIPQYNDALTLDYLVKLEAAGGVCTIWPPHCIIGTKGWSVDERVFEAIERWSIASGKSYELISKGMYQATEHYSIFKAAVEYVDIKATLFNDDLLARLNTFDKVYIVGEAADFCVASSLSDMLYRLPEIAPKLYMLTDCMSYIIEGNRKTESVFEHAEKLGVAFCKSTKI